MTTMSNIKFMRMKEVQKIIGLSRTAIYQRVKDGKFPQPLCFPNMPRAKFWDSREIEQWQLDAIKQAKENIKMCESILS